MSISIYQRYFLCYLDRDRLIDGCTSTTTLTTISYSADYQWKISAQHHVNNCLATSWQEHVLFQHDGLDLIVLAHWNSTPRVDFSPQIIMIPIQPVFILNATTYFAYFKMICLILLRMEHSIYRFGWNIIIRYRKNIWSKLYQK